MKNLLINACTSALTVASVVAMPQNLMSATISPAIVESFASMPTYNGEDLELTVDNRGYHFRLWSPMAEEVRISFYESGTGGKAFAHAAMTPNAATGVWSLDTTEKLMDKFYTFSIKYQGKWLDETPGVWAKAVGVNGKRAAIIDFAKTNPEGWANDRGPEVKHFTDVILYEMHHRDFSMHRNSGITNKGKFVAML